MFLLSFSRQGWIQQAASELLHIQVISVRLVPTSQEDKENLGVQVSG